jgi:hypothetical protein
MCAEDCYGDENWVTKKKHPKGNGNQIIKYKTKSIFIFGAFNWKSITFHASAFSSPSSSYMKIENP